MIITCTNTSYCTCNVNLDHVTVMIIISLGRVSYINTAELYTEAYVVLSTYWILVVLGAFLMVILIGDPSALKSVYLLCLFIFFIIYQVFLKCIFVCLSVCLFIHLIIYPFMFYLSIYPNISIYLPGFPQMVGIPDVPSMVYIINICRVTSGANIYISI